ncbi:hypothetical protein E1161_07450 [Saccharopolyspora aridisoli]|uniref:Uncharacterized protein n=1 Tax=Saccharopolyspora aridisoli TaxID=2530385 RepID=A0A4R4UYL8_9PSEU|nr:hypothetical protein [Saccharopolyspora aridisoli]TDC94374.1 hypothetical protein E1161_07450 [Saccharopolyspora aridisoli]
MESIRVNRAETSMDDRMITTYQERPFTGEVVDFAEDGSTVELTSFANGIEHGPQSEWFPGGQKRLEASAITEKR